MNEPNQLEQDAPGIKRYAYLLRLWRTSQSDSSNWHASLENSLTGERFGFANLEQLFAFLMALIERENKRNPKHSQKTTTESK